MARVKRCDGTSSSQKVLSKAKGYYGARSRVFRVAKQAVTKAGQYAYRDRRQRKRQFRALDYSYQRPVPCQRHDLQPFDQWPEKSRCCAGPARFG